MSGLEVILLIAGLVIIVVSFIFSAKNDDGAVSGTAELSNKQKEDIKNQILTVFDEQMENYTEKTESELNALSTRKMSEMNEYSENILNEINKNHNEVMFLYDMLNEKKKEINNAVRDLNAIKKEIAIAEGNISTSDAKQQNVDSETQDEHTKKNNKTKTTSKSKSEKILDQLDAVAEAVSDDVEADNTVNVKTRKKSQPGRTAAERARNTVKKETIRDDNKDPKAFETGNNNEKILELNAQGKSNVEIAKELGLGIGEVKLVIDLFRGGK